ncbi:hypothetical protein CHUAL_008175 [Chamberlinius hualienensis]
MKYAVLVGILILALAQTIVMEPIDGKVHIVDRRNLISGPLYAFAELLDVIPFTSGLTAPLKSTAKLISELTSGFSR